jgi:large subunit ribosomal protein L9
MKVLLLKDVYKLGRAGDVKKVANGYGRNYLIPQGLAMIATPGAMRQAERIRTAADTHRVELNQELSGDAQKLAGQALFFAARASETGRLYGSVTTRMVADEVKDKIGIEISHRQIETEPLRILGKYTIPVRLTIDLAPELTVVIHREGTLPTLLEDDEEAEEKVEAPVAEAAEVLEFAEEVSPVEESPADDAAEETPEADSE